MKMMPFIKIIGKRIAPVAISFAATAVINKGLSYIQEADPHFAQTKNGLTIIKTIKLEDDTCIRVLQQKGAFESATYLDDRRYEPVFAYQRAFDHLFLSTQTMNDILMLGGGGYAWPKHVIATKLNTHLDVVEIDPDITVIAKKWFFLDQLTQDYPRAERDLNIIHDDARVFLEESPIVYSAIVNDTFSGKSPVMSMATVEAARLIKEHLCTGGIYATNVVSEQEGRDITFLRSVVTTLHEEFDYIWIIPCEDELFGLEDNYLVLASDTDHHFGDAMPFDNDFFSSVLRDNPHAIAESN